MKEKKTITQRIHIQIQIRIQIHIQIQNPILIPMQKINQNLHIIQNQVVQEKKVHQILIIIAGKKEQYL